MIERNGMEGPQPRFRRVVVAMALFIAFVLALTGVGTLMFSDIIRSATNIDDNRSKLAARMALLALKTRIGGTVQDNAVWADAYDAIHSDTVAGWVEENWGAVSGSYPLYDGLVIFDRSAKPVIAYHKGKAEAPEAVFRSSLSEQVAQAYAHPEKAVTAFASTVSGVAVTGMQVIQREEGGPIGASDKVLAFYKLLGPEVISEIRQEQSLLELSVSSKPANDMLSMPISGADGEVLSYLAWRSADPGELLYQRAKPLVALSILVLVLFVCAGAYMAYDESQRLSRSARRAWALATHDSLSGLFNRSGFLAMVEDRRGADGRAPGALFLLDLDGFKAVNDNWGHPVGDTLIREVAATLSNCHPDIRLVARFGGDEFALYTDAADRAAEIGDVVLSLFRQPFTVRGLTIKVGVSIGIADSDGGIATEEMLRRADIALYDAKEKGKERVVIYDRALGDAKAAEYRLERDLRNAIETGDVFPFFQPLVDAQTRTLVGFEALARWNRPHDPITPDRFIALAERSGLMDMLGATLLEQSLEEAAKWKDYLLSVNISPLQLCNPRFPLQVENLIAKTGFDPHKLTMEVTEGALIANPEQARSAIHALKKLGIRFALDDFGSGYASIGVLRQFGFDRIKIDRSLVVAADETENGAAVIQATIALARALDVPVTAEGVERQEQADFLTLSGCDQLQGFLLGRPASASQVFRDFPLGTDGKPMARAS